MEVNKIEVLKRLVEREKAARKAAEAILEEKSLELYNISEKLRKVNEKLEKTLKQKDYQIKSVFQTITDAYVVIDLSGHVLKMNAAAKELIGYDVDIEPINLLKVVKKEYIDYTIKVFKELYNKGSFQNYTSVILTKDNEEKIVQINANIIFGENGKPIAAHGIARDISSQIALNNRLKESEERLSTIVKNLFTGILLEDENRNIVVTNSEFCSMFSIEASPEALVGANCTNAAKESKHFFKEPEKFLNRINHILKQKKLVHGDELELVDGRVFERNYIPIYVKGDYKGHLWSYSDITIKRKYTESLKSEKEKYSKIINNMNLGLVESDKDGLITFVNNNFCEVSGYTKEELYNQKAENLMILAEDTNRVAELRARSESGLSESFEIKIKSKNKGIRHLLVSGAPVFGLNEQIIGGISINFDITDQKKLELTKENLLKSLAEQNERLSEYAHIVSHDLRSPLRNISALLSWTKEDFKSKLGYESIENLDLIQQRVEKMDHLIENILQYSSIGQNLLKKERVDLNLLITEITELIYTPPNITVKTLKEFPFIMGDRTQIQQVFLNLLSNAINYIDKEKGLVEIDFTEDDSYYTFSIKDNGMGIAEENKSKIFTIFKSLGHHEKSSGIGLSIVKKIINLYQGDIWIESELGIGTTFFFSFKKYIT